ncbi:hypothetical protein E6C27_scaffold329G002390 [Cucumis melo var. makuwa]|uniref:Uncharacterized protein n=1 Tax=Cucumis melo var. makuwa TaxID=1194695 RepID=A0A5A7VBB6_CUCMM|nr:hypothetical protein E6C27_scaffold329G002390 [Cucumis melo var. makuwa]
MGLICASFGSARLICASFGSTRLICASFGITRLIGVSFWITRLICAFYGTTRLLCRVRAQRGADRRGAGRMREGHMDASNFLIASADVFLLSSDLSLVQKVGSLQQLHWLGWREELAGRLGIAEAAGQERGAACGRRRGLTGARAAHAGVRLGYGTGTARVRLDTDGYERDSGYEEEIQTVETKRTGQGSNEERLDARSMAKQLDARSTTKRLDARSKAVTARQRPTADGEVLTETRLLSDGFQAEETRVLLRSAMDRWLEARVDIEYILGFITIEQEKISYFGHRIYFNKKCLILVH